MQLHKMNLSSGLKLFWQAIPEPAKVLEVGKAFPLLGSSASQQVRGLNLRLPSKPLTGLKGRAALLPAPPDIIPTGRGDEAFFIGGGGASGAPVRWHNVTPGLDATHATTLYVSLHLAFFSLPRPCHPRVSPPSCSRHSASPCIFIPHSQVIKNTHPEPQVPSRVHLRYAVLISGFLCTAQCFDSAHYIYSCFIRKNII